MVLHDVLNQLVVLEAAGLHHNDVRPWNVLVARDGHASLIDYGAISPDAGDCGSPSNLFIAFLVFACEVWGGTSSRLHGACLPRFDPDHLPPPYQSAFWSMLQSPPSQWRFARLLDDILNPGIVERLDTVGFQAVLRAANECAAQLDARLTQFEAELGRSREALTVALSTKDAEIAELLSNIRAANQREIDTKNAEIEALRSEMHKIGRREVSLASELVAATKAAEKRAAGIKALRAKVHDAGRREESLTAALAAATSALEISRADAAHRATNEALLHKQLTALRDSTSWRLTGPLRLLRRLVGSRAGGIVLATPRTERPAPRPNR